jgi:diphthamide biosynthesis protein 3
VQEELMSGEEIARCPSCSLIIRVVYDPEMFAPEEEEEEGESLAASAQELLVA